MDNIVAKLLNKKNKKVFILGMIILISFILLNICIEMIAINQANMKMGLLEKNQLKLLQVFGQSKTTEDMNLDENVFKQTEHVLFAVKTTPIIINLFNEKEEPYEKDGVFIYEIPRNYGSYVGIEGELQDDIIYCPRDTISKEALEHGQLDAIYRGLGLKLKEYDEQPPNMLNSAQFVTKATYEKIEKCQRKEIGDEYVDLLASTPQYLVGVDRTENVFDIVEVLKSSFENYDIQISYQLSGMKLFVKNSKAMTILQIGVGVVIVVIALFIIYAFTNTFFSNQEKNMMILYINGMKRGAIASQMYQWIAGKLIKPGILILIVSSISYLFVSIRIIKTFNVGAFVLILLTNLFVEIVCLNFLRWAIKRRMLRKTANENIIALIRN